MKKNLLLILSFLIVANCFSQSDEKNNLGERIFLPSLEIGYISENSKLLSDGLLVKTSLEYRFSNPSGFFLRINYDTYDTSYELINLDNLSNVVKGTASFSDLIVGGGYRWSLKDNFRLFLLLQPGVKFYDFPTATLEGNTVLISQDGKSIFTSRTTFGLEYYINSKSAIIFDIFQSQIWDKRDFWQSNTGAYGLSVGFITALY